MSQRRKSESSLRLWLIALLLPATSVGFFAGAFYEATRLRRITCMFVLKPWSPVT